MSTELILENIARHIHLTAEEQQYFVSLLQTRQLKRKEFLLQSGQICKYSAFTVSGCLRGYTVDEGGLERVLNFAPQGWWMADMYSLLSQKPGTLDIEAIENTDLRLLSKANQEVLYQKVPKFERFFRIITENSLVAYQQRVMDNLSLAAEERYNNFCKRYPSLIYSVPKKDVASYIGVTPEFLSRMLHKMLKG
ncbi:Crp/Fnr family transcriptional regulator [Mucilaginibacter sp. RS28]|uniref:Crp/Fnr family transcriptional regulator n=1 Tax=Mucilaginibacter straminoryzae TaxID=2932774 RepID=A0A9X1X4W7_9SPHI|nr:Crp/Fnr family transcriptional regulator [Mucilaginibacter straminoryzae]MCJ8210998.1 Crp/Fnr family transcriptional regulator [Mucilaginibacter straminoryzae]